MKFESEKELEDILQDSWFDTGFVFGDGGQEDYLLRQINVEPYGIIDLLGISLDYDNFIITIYELKNTAITKSHIAQISRYRTAIKKILEKYFSKQKFVTVNGVIVCTGAGTGDIVYLYDNINWLTVKTVDICVDGLLFDDHYNWYSTGDLKMPKIKHLKDMKRRYINAIRHERKLLGDKNE